MKWNMLYILFAGLVFASCKKDNYPAPGASFTGRIVYKGEAINVSQQDVYFELWESGWGKKTPINVAVAQDGSFSALLFDADYQLIIPANQGPFKTIKDAATHTDTMLLKLHGSTKLDIEVMPYYMIRQPQFTVGNGRIQATCQIEQIIQGADARPIERVSLYVNRVQLTDGNLKMKWADLSGGSITDPSHISLQTDIPTIVPAQDYVFARIGVKIQGVEDMVFSPVQKVALK